MYFNIVILDAHRQAHKWMLNIFNWYLYNNKILGCLGLVGLDRSQWFQPVLFPFHLRLLQSTHSVIQSNDLMKNNCGFLFSTLTIKKRVTNVTVTTISAAHESRRDMYTNRALYTPRGYDTARVMTVLKWFTIFSDRSAASSFDFPASIAPFWHLYLPQVLWIYTIAIMTYAFFPFLVLFQLTTIKMLTCAPHIVPQRRSVRVFGIAVIHSHSTQIARFVQILCSLLSLFMVCKALISISSYYLYIE